MLSDSLHTYAWDALGRPTTIDTVTITYDALGRMVEQNKSGSYTEIVYDPLGSKLALMSNTSTLKQGFAPLPGGATAVYNASGLQYYRHPDWLGSSRFASTPSRTMYNDLAFAPFGEPYAQAGGSDTSFTGQNQDTTTNLYDFMYREYGIQGRWPSPDPAGVAAVNPANPQSWNRYAYVLNNPLALIDPLGLYTFLYDVQICTGDTSFSVTGGVGVNANCTDYIVVYDDGGGYYGGGSGSGDGNESGGGLVAPPPPPVLTNKAPQTPPCKLSVGQRVSLGIQGALNSGIGLYKAFQGTVAALGGLGLAPESGGLSLTATVTGSYFAVTGAGQTGTGFSQLGRSATGNGGPETTFEQYSTLASGPISATEVLASGFSVADAERAANFESVFTAGSGLINSPGFSSLIDAGLTFAGLSNTGGCHQ